MPSATALQSPSQLLHYLPAHRILICTECRYAIQPSAISRHLKDLHHIYRSDRQELVEYAKELDLLDPGDVVLPSPHEAAIPLLPTENGLACSADGCTHLCVTVKRMKSHWANAHRDVVGTGGSQWRPVTLQTFFRGNQLRYFVVSGASTPEPKPGQSPATDSDASSLISQTPTPPDWTPDDIALFEHFKHSTYLDLGRGPGSERAWNTDIPEMSYSHDFLKHGILACSALHLAVLHPCDRRRYQMTAACHQARALPLFRTAIANPTRENCEAVLAFSHLLIVHCFASEEADEELLLVKENGLPDWLQVIRGSCTMFATLWPFIQQGSLAAIIEEGLIEDALPMVPENPAYAARLKELVGLPFFGKSPMLRGAFNDKVSAYSGALLALSRAFVMAQAAKEKAWFTVWTAVQIWPARVPMDYLELLRARDPAALVLLAHYCVLLEPLEHKWYMNGFRKRLLERIYGQLDEEWRQWLDWPFAEAGLNPEGVMEDVRYEML